MRMTRGLLLLSWPLVTLLPACAAVGSGTEASPELHYTLRWAADDPPRVAATLELAGSDSGASEFGLRTGWGGVPDDGAWILEVRACDDTGRQLPVQALGQARYRVQHAPSAPLRLSWELAPLPDEGADHSNEYRPVVRPGLLHLIGSNGLLAPAWLPDDAPRDIALSWQGFAERGWRTLCSHGDAEVRVQRPLSEFLQAVFVGGDLQVEQRPAPGGRMLVAMPGGGFSFQAAELADACAGILQAERTFFGDSSQAYYLITALPMGKADPNSFSLGGTGLTDSFALFCQRGASLDPEGNTRDRILRVLAHELFHNWCGLEISPEDPEREAYWFTEGFTDFYTGRMLRHAGLESEAERREWVNQLLASYWCSPVREQGNAAIAEGFWKSAELGQLPYQRGAVAALSLDAEMRRVSDGRRTLDDGMRELLREARAGERFSTGELLERFSRWTSADYAARLSRFLGQGGTLELDPAAFANFGQLQSVVAYLHDPGFDVSATIQSRRVSGVREGGPAWNAGLREGQELRGLTYYGPGQDAPVEVQVAGAADKISFLPRGTEVSVPRIQPAEGAAEP
ncbi:MAG: hypothetical protein EYC70_09890 [Planctomycetota bacterium]|nr:MAG: hypothetical protein EYC70_09890 [Planctomycetota bacterium]